MSILLLNGKTANSKPYEQLVINKANRLLIPTMNGLMPYDININGLDRPPVLHGCVFYAPLYHPALAVPSGKAFKDLVGGNSCTVTGATWGNQGRVFDVDDYITLGSTSSLYLPVFTLNAWVKPTANVDDFRTIFDKSVSTVNRNYWLNVASGTGLLTLRFSSIGVSAIITGATALNDNVFRFVTGMYNGTNMSLFVNAVSDATPVSQGTPDNPSALPYIGFTTVAANRGFYGTIGEVWIYNRELTAGEILQIYNMTKWRYL
jgi:hypothetical protein